MKLKRLDLFLLKTFLPLFFMTFGICLFIILMQFLWKYVDEMVGKGVGLSILGEMFFYAALSFVPLALPLAILLASLMTFGTMGEQLELLAMKSSGISLLRIMRSLIIFLCFVSVGVFFFQNNVLPASQVKMWTLMKSIKDKSPELEIPEGVFYKEIRGYSLYVKKKTNQGLLKELMIYDYSEGFNNAQVIVADSGRLKVSNDKLFLVLILYEGESFRNLKDQKPTQSNEAIPYQKESFREKEILIRFDSNFNRESESIMQDRYIGKNIRDLQASIDSMTIYIEEVKQQNADRLQRRSYRHNFMSRDETDYIESQIGDEERAEREGVAMSTINFDTLFLSQPQTLQLSLLSQVSSAIEEVKYEYRFNSLILAAEEKELRRHHTEKIKKYTLSFACLIFFFIGTPLGAIIRKGGLGMPVVLSVSLFIFYYIIDNVGFKMADNGMWQPWQGMWLSSAVLLPLGCFLTYKAVNDSVILNVDTYISGVQRLFGKRMTRRIVKKEVIITAVDNAELAAQIEQLQATSARFLHNNKRMMSYLSFWREGACDRHALQLTSDLEAMVEWAANSEQNLVLNKLMDYPVLNPHYLFPFRLSRKVGLGVGCLLPLGVPLYLFALYRRKLFLKGVKTVEGVNEELLAIVTA